MSPAVRTILFGLADPAQAIEAAMLGVDAVVVAVGRGSPPEVAPEMAREIARNLPPLVGRFALIGRRAPLPDGFGGAVTEGRAARPPGAAVHIVRMAHAAALPERLPRDADGLWVRPAPRGSSTATRFDYARLERLARRLPVVLEIPDGAAGVEVAIRLGRPHAVLFGEAVWFRAGIVDLERLERALAVVGRLNRRLGEAGPEIF